MRQLLAELTALLEGGRDCVFCTVVETRGSTPQKAGAAMLVLPDGGQRGTLGGGCVEAEVKRRALGGLPAAELFTFNLDDDYGWDDGLICGGRMAVLADPLGNARRPENAIDYYRRYRELVEAGAGLTEAVALADSGLPPGSRYLFDAAGRPAARLATAAAPDELTGRLKPLAGRPRPWVQKGWAFLPQLPRVTLLIAGGGHVGEAVARLAATVDFDVWVLDDRERYAGRDRFPSAQRLLVSDIGRTLKAMVEAGEVTPSVYALVVTRGHNHDEEALYHLAGSPAGYVGMIGSKRKIRLIYEDLIAKDVPAAALERVHAPLGLEIGSQTVGEIAVSIVAELIAVRNLGSSPRPLPTVSV